MDSTRLDEAARDASHRAMARRFLDAQRAVGDLVLERPASHAPRTIGSRSTNGMELLLVHGSPEDPTEPMTHDLDDDEISALIGDDPADIVVCGMSHTPFVRELAEGMKIVNVGSVGRCARWRRRPRHLHRDEPERRAHRPDQHPARRRDRARHVNPRTREIRGVSRRIAGTIEQYDAEHSPNAALGLRFALEQPRQWGDH